MSDLQVIIITNEAEQEKVLLFDPQEGRASKRQLCMYLNFRNIVNVLLIENIYALAWLVLSIVAPLWMASIVERPYTILVPPQAQTGLHLAPSSPCTRLGDCGAFATSFNVSLEASLDFAPSTAYPPVLFASVSHPNAQWWVAGVASSPLSQLNQRWEITGGCFGAPGGRLYLVACLPAVGEVFVQGDQLRGPPFDDRCTAIGTWCGGSCSSVIIPPHCDAVSHEITSLTNHQRGDIFGNNATLAPGAYVFSTRSTGYMAMAFIFVTALSFITFLLNHCAPVAACLQRLGKSDNEIARSQCTALDKLKYKNKEVVVAVVSIFCYEKVFHITRNLIGVACSWTTLAKVTKELGFTKTRLIHYVVDNSKSKGDCMSALLVRFINFYNENTDINWEGIMKGLQDAPFEPTPEEYSAMIPLSLRDAIAGFLADLQDDDKRFFEPFSSPARFWRAASPTGTSTEKALPKLISESVYVEFEIVRLASGNRSKVAALQECGKLFHNYKQDALGFLAIMDARHMMTPAFWQYALPSFFVQGSAIGVIPSNEADGSRGSEEYFENTTMRLAQVMQHFPGVQPVDDYFDRGNFFNYLYSNALRNQAQSVSSCGTNALWSMRDTPNGTKFNFSGKTLIEDTETSHAFMEQGETSTYISKGLVHGSVKNPEEYGEAPSRWAAGAIQLLFYQPSSIRLLLYSCIAYILTPMLISLVVTRIRHGEWLLLAVWCVLVACAAVWAATSSHKHRAAQTVIRMVNTTYWLTGPITAVFWMVFVPVYILLSGRLPFQFNAEAMMIGGLVVSALQWVMVVLAKRWAKAEEMHLWRSQQAWFALWPLNFLGIPRLLNPNTSWQISTIQAKFTLFINLCEFLLLCSSLFVALLDIRARVASLAGAAALLAGAFSAAYAILLLFPTTSYLFNSILFHKRHPYNTSSRHILGAFLILSLITYMVYSPDWSLAFSQFFIPAPLSWYSP